MGDEHCEISRTHHKGGVNDVGTITISLSFTDLLCSFRDDAVGLCEGRHARVTAPTAAKRSPPPTNHDQIDNPLDFSQLNGSHLRLRAWLSACPHIAQTFGPF